MKAVRRRGVPTGRIRGRVHNRLCNVVLLTGTLLSKRPGALNALLSLEAGLAGHEGPCSQTISGG